MAPRPQPSGAVVPGVVAYQRGRKWSYRIELERDPLTNERNFEYDHGYLTRDDATAAALVARSQHARGQRVSPAARTVAEFAAEWLKAVHDAIKPSTYTNYQDYLGAYVLPAIGERKLQRIDVPTLNALYRHLLGAGRRKRDTNTVMHEYWQARRVSGVEPTPRQIADACSVTIHAARKAVVRYREGRIPKATSPGLAPKTVKNVHRMLHRALSDAVAWRYLEYNPAAHASLPRQSRKGQRRKGATWTPEELNTWLKVATVDPDAGMWVLAATTGMRRSELAGAERELLDLEGGMLELGDTRVVVAGKAIEEDGKSESGRRVISLDPLTVHYLQRHVAKLEEHQSAFGGGYHHHGKLFCHPDGRPIHPDTITRRFNRLVDLAGVRKIRLHDVRHTYATLSLDAGIDPKVVADRIGHSNMAYTLAIYTHPSTGRDRTAAEKVAGVIFGDSWRVPPDEQR